jgi:hypothetical protein
MRNTPAPMQKSKQVDAPRNEHAPVSSEVYKNIADAILRSYSKDLYNINREAPDVYTVYNKRISKTWHSKFHDYVSGAAMAFNPLPTKWASGKHDVSYDFNALSNDMRSVSDDLNSVWITVAHLRNRYKIK